MTKRTRIVVTVFLGWAGGHHFIDGRTGMGLLYFFTFGLLGIGWFIDIIKALILHQETMDKQDAYRKEVNEYRRNMKQLKAAERAEVMQQSMIKSNELKAQGVAHCPKCKSTSIQYVERRKKLSVGRAVVGGTLLGPLGATVGAVTSNKHKGYIKCLNCGNTYKN